jgi:hypothetical protein
MVVVVTVADVVVLVSVTDVVVVVCVVAVTDEVVVVSVVVVAVTCGTKVKQPMFYQRKMAKTSAGSHPRGYDAIELQQQCRYVYMFQVSPSNMSLLFCLVVGFDTCSILINKNTRGAGPDMPREVGILHAHHT